MTTRQELPTDLIADDLFAGAGGWDLAARALGIHARGVENMKAARATRDAAGLTTIHDNVWTFVPDGRATGLIASPPCQTFSQAGGGSGRKNLEAVLTLMRQIPRLTMAELRDAAQHLEDERTALVLTPLWFLIHHDHYRWAAWEQVPGVLPVWEAAAVMLQHFGWRVWTGKLTSEMYGDPQTRVRAVLIAAKDHPVGPPTPTHSRYYSRDPQRIDPGMPRWISMAEALGWGLRRRPSFTLTGGGNHGKGDPTGMPWGGQSVRDTLDAAHAVGGEEWQHGNHWEQVPHDTATCQCDPEPCPGMRVGFPRRADSEDVVTIDGTDYRARDLRSVDQPAQTVTGKVRSWEVTHADGEPCTCDVTFTATNPRPNAAHRTPCQPAPTMAFGHEEPRWNDRDQTEEPEERWQVAGGVAGSGVPRHQSHPSPTVTGMGSAAWIADPESYLGTERDPGPARANPREITPDGLPRFAQQSDNDPDLEWPDNRPATVVAGREIVQAPGATANRFNNSTKSRNDGVRVSVAEAGILQGFPPDFPWQGNKSKRYLQAGNAVPVRLARAVLAVAIGERTELTTAPADPDPEDAQTTLW